MASYIQNFKGFVNELHMPHHQSRRGAIDMLPNSARHGTVKLRDEFRNAPEEVQQEIIQLVHEIGEAGMLRRLKSRLSSLYSLNQLIDLMKSMLSHSHKEEMTPGFEME